MAPVASAPEQAGESATVVGIATDQATVALEVRRVTAREDRLRAGRCLDALAAVPVTEGTLLVTPSTRSSNGTA